MKKKILTGLAIAAWAFSLLAARAEELMVAVVGPITGSYAVIGEQMRRGADLAVADINAKGGLLGKHVTLLVGDDACEPKQAVAVANRMVNSGVIFVDGHFCSGSSIPASSVYAENGVLEISPASTNPLYTDDAATKGWNNIFRVCGRDDAQGRVAGQYIAAHFKGQAVAIINDKSAYGKGLAEETKKAMNAAGMTEAMYESINQDDKDFSALISKMKQADIRVIYLGGYHTQAGLLVRQAHEQGLKAVLAAGDALATEEFWKITGPAGAGTLMTFAPDPRNLGSAKEVVARFRQQGYDPEGYTLYSYAAIQVFAEAAAQAKSVMLDDVSKALHGGRFETVIGQIGFDAKGDVIGPDYVVYAWNDSTYRQIDQ
ncbi:MAG TPA: branched-chain amino acid ABC transporter substrate-binding protein [Stellaceae bacterium]|nr:branched-chain amino acid ABC transporter substrate-binding protein [Stellaceae bacterium]